LFVENRSHKEKAIDLRPLEGCGALRELRVEMAHSILRLPVRLHLTELHLLCVRPDAISEILSFGTLKTFALQVEELLEGRLDLRSLRQLESFRIRLSSSASISLPSSVTRLRLTASSPLIIANTEDLVHLSEVTVSCPMIDFDTFRSLLKLPNVRRFCHPKQFAFDSVMPKEAIERGIEVVRY
jgi:hypothetical protein